MAGTSYNYYNVTSASKCACLSILLCLPASCEQVNLLLTKVLIRQFLSDVWKIIWTIHQWCLFKLLPLESFKDSQFIGNILSPKYEYDWQWTSICDERLVQIWR